MSSLDLLRASIANSLVSGINIADVFSIDLYTGNGTTQSIVNGLDLSTSGGLVWGKGRNVTSSHLLYDTVRGAQKYLQTNSTTVEGTDVNSLTAFNTTGFSLGSSLVSNTNTKTYAAWSFLKAPNFFDVVTYTGDGIAGRTVAHSLGVAPGMVIVKSTADISNWSWMVQHISRGGTKYLVLNATGAEADGSPVLWNDTAADTSNVTLGSSPSVNRLGYLYVMYVFAHDTSATGMIQCGGYTGDGTTSHVITLGWIPQYIMIKRATGGTGYWYIFDTARTPSFTGADAYVLPNSTNPENTFATIAEATNGFEILTADQEFNASGSDYIYMAIRKV